MNLGLVSYEFRNGDLEFNISQVERAMRAAQGRADMLCFGETFLQGFDACSWNYETDKDIAVSQDSAVMERLRALTLRYETDLLIGYVEREGDSLYSSCMVIVKGEIIHNYRRISKNWKEYDITDHHYKEGTAVEPFCYHGKSLLLTLCGDMWIYPERFRAEDVLIWPVYVNFTIEEWSQNEMDYAEQASLGCRRTVMINSITRDPPAHGNAFFFENGAVAAKLEYDKEDILVVQL